MAIIRKPKSWSGSSLLLQSLTVTYFVSGYSSHYHTLIFWTVTTVNLSFWNLDQSSSVVFIGALRLVIARRLSHTLFIPLSSYGIFGRGSSKQMYCKRVLVTSHGFSMVSLPLLLWTAAPLIRSAAVLLLFACPVALLRKASAWTFVFAFVKKSADG